MLFGEYEGDAWADERRLAHSHDVNETMQFLRIGSRRAVKWYLGIALAMTVAWGVMQWLVTPPTGLIRTFYLRNGAGGEQFHQERTSDISLAFLEEDPALPRQLFGVVWLGFWYLPQAQTVDLYAGADDRVEVLVDGWRVLQHTPQVGVHTTGETITLSAGTHEIIVRYEQDRGDLYLDVQHAFDGRTPRSLVPTQLFPTRPEFEDFVLATATYWLTRLVALLWMVPVAVQLMVVAGWVADRAALSWVVRRTTSLSRAVAIGFQHVTGPSLTRTLHVFALTALAVAHPLFQVVSREPSFFAARNTTLLDLVGLIGIVCVALPTLLLGIEVTLARFSATAANVAHGMVLTVLGGAFLMPLLKRAEGLSAPQSIGLALLIAGVVALSYQRTGGVRSFVTALSPAIIIVPALFLMTPDVREAVVRTDDLFSRAQIRHAPPIVFVVFDEFPVNSLLDNNHEIDRVRYPNFARLADSAGWYRNASTVSSETIWAVPAIVAGQYPTNPNAVPTRRHFPDNLFTMLSGDYRMTVFGRFLQLCPANSCTYDLEVHDSLSALVSDLGVVFLHIISPRSIAERLPPILGNWKDFAVRRLFRNEEGGRRRNDRISEFDRFLATITPDREGQLYFLHTLTPHMPFEYVPSGHRYSAPDYQAYREGGEGLFRHSDPWLAPVLHQRHLLQVGFVDHFIGSLLDRLQAQGIYDEALIIITADHGASFQHGLPRRRSTEGTRGDVMLVPLIIKLPNQVEGFISDRNVETVDIVPTIASVLSSRVPYDVDGRSLLDSVQTERTEKVFVQRSRVRVRLENLDPDLDHRYAGLEQKLSHFALGLHALGPHAPLVGLSLSTLEIRSGTDTLVRLETPRAFHDVDLGAETLPLSVRGTMTDLVEERVSLAIAVNGVVVATTQSYQEHDEWAFASMIPEEALTPGANELEVFVVDSAGVLTSATPNTPH